MIKFIHIDYRKPRAKEEHGMYAISNVDTNTASIFFNTDMHRKGKELSDTFFHEMVHVFVAFHGAEGQMSPAKEEKLARALGKACAEILK